MGRFTGMKLKKKIVIPALIATDYKNTAFLRVTLRDLDGISDYFTNFVITT